MKIRTCKTESLSFSEVFQLALDTYTQLGILTPPATSGNLRLLLSKLWNNIEQVIIAEKNGWLKGFLSLNYGKSGHAHFGPWTPYLKKGTNASELAQQLINKGIAAAKAKHSRMAWVQFDMVPGRERALDTFSSWYRSNGFSEPFQSPMLTRPLHQFPSFDPFGSTQPALPHGYNIRLLEEVKPKKIFECYSQAFSSIEDSYFHLRTDKENRETLLGKEIRESQISDASLALFEGKLLVGFTNLRMVPEMPNMAHLSPMAILPEYQRRGLGTMLLSKSIRLLTAKGYQMLSLGLDAKNIPAMRFYTRLDFSEAFRMFVQTRKIK